MKKRKSARTGRHALFTWLILLPALLSGSTGCSSSGENKSMMEVTTVAENIAPVANAGEHRVHALRTGQTVKLIRLDGSGSHDEDGTVETHTWTGFPDPADEARPLLFLPQGIYRFQLVVTDDDGAQSDPDTVVIIVRKPHTDAPVADAGPDATYTLHEEQTSMAVPLDGSASFDDDGSIRKYAWSGNPDPENVVQPTVTLPVGTHVFTLVVTDNDGLRSEADTVTITVKKADDMLPVADAGPDADYLLTQGQSAMTVPLDGSGSYDEDGTVESYTWTGNPDPEDVIGPTVILPAGTHVFTLAVTDNDGLQSAPDTVTVTVRGPEDVLPVAEAGPDANYLLPEGQDEMAVILDGSGSHDDDGIVTAYAWAGDPDPEDVAAPTVSLAEGVYEFALVVTDDDGYQSTPDFVTVTVAGSQNIPPSADPRPERDLRPRNLAGGDGCHPGRQRVPRCRWDNHCLHLDG